jgi:adenylate cyclase
MRPRQAGARPCRGVTNLASRLCGEAAPWQILVTQRVHAATEDIAVSRPVGELNLRGFSKPVLAFGIDALDAARVTS